jgi:hypothetical protein
MNIVNNSWATWRHQQCVESSTPATPRVQARYRSIDGNEAVSTCPVCASLTVPDTVHLLPPG